MQKMHTHARTHARTHAHTHASTHACIHAHTVQSDGTERRSGLTEIFWEEKCLELTFEGRESSRVPDVLGEIVPDVFMAWVHVHGLGPCSWWANKVKADSPESQSAEESISQALTAQAHVSSHRISYWFAFICRLGKTLALPTMQCAWCPKLEPDWTLHDNSTG